MYVMGIDLGTGGARVVVCDGKGKVIALTHQELPEMKSPDLPAGYHEQEVDSWWKAVVSAIRQALDEMRQKKLGIEAIKAISVTSTSGTILPLGKNNQVLHPALMYNDNRAGVEANSINEAAGDFNQQHGRSFNASFALAKILWMKRNKPEIFNETTKWIHASDYLVGKLTGEFGISDYSNALKTGYDLIHYCWPNFIENELGIHSQLLPKVVAPGEIIGTVSKTCASETGLIESTIVCAGMTDSSASLLATGAANPGDWSSTIGTTLSIKGITEELVHDPGGVVYCHRHPQGWWLPGAASNVGGEWLKVLFAEVNKTEMDQKAKEFGFSNLLVYPLVRKGERFPFLNSSAQGFTVGKPVNDVDAYRGYLEGVGLIERLCFEVLQGLGAGVGQNIYISGGAARSVEWTQIRADILQKRLFIPELPESCMGAAILAAANTLYSNLVEAGKQMVQVVRSIDPDPHVFRVYKEKYEMLVDQLKQKQYLS